MPPDKERATEPAFHVAAHELAARSRVTAAVEISTAAFLFATAELSTTVLTVISDQPDPIGARLAAFFVHYNLERHPLPLVQFISVCDVANVHKNVCGAAVRTYESEPAIIVESHNYA
jgi:hypothetical protein